MKKIIMTFSILVLAIVTILLVGGSKSELNEMTSITDINYNESLKELNNPERGFYEPIGINMQEDNNRVLNPKNNLVHLRVGIGAFSSKVNGKDDLKFTDNMLSSLDQTLKNIKQNGGSVIIRFAYDNFNGTKDLEPSLDMILTHIGQLKDLFYNNKDVIAYVELGFFGPWGEMHSSQVCTKENVSAAIDAMLSSVPQNIKIGVRTPAYYASWAGVSLDKLNEDITIPESKAYRVGLYNDGYLGSESDLGTFKNREIETIWLSNQAKHTLYGGEVVANYASGTPLNTIEYISKEAFLTHTTYLNIRWNNNVIDSWKNTIYNGNDELYKGKSAFLYINNHLGYRFVLKSSILSTDITIGDNLDGLLKIENVGFGNLVNEKKTTIILTNNEFIYEISTNIDARTWNSKEINEVPIDIKTPDNIKIGNYKVYLRISQSGNILNDNNYNCLEFANEEIWNEQIGANYIGSINIKERKTSTTSSTTTKKPTSTSTTKPNNQENDILYVTPEETKKTKPTTKPITTRMSTTSKKITQTTIKKTKTKKKTTSIKSSTTTTSTTKINENINNDVSVVKEKNTSNNLKALVILLLIAIILFLIFLTHKKI